MTLDEIKNLIIHLIDKPGTVNIRDRDYKLMHERHNRLLLFIRIYVLLRY